MSMSKKLKLPVVEKSRRHRTIHAESSNQSVRELIQAWRRLSAERRAKKATSMPSSMLNVSKLKHVHNTSALHVRRRSSLKSKPSTHRSSVVSEKEANVKVIHYKETPRTSNVTRISMDQGTNLCYHQPINWPLPANSNDQQKTRETNQSQPKKATII